MINKVFIIKQFCKKDILNTLNEWTMSNYKNPILFTDANMGKKGTRLTTRYTTTNKLIFPDCATLLRKDIISKIGFKNYRTPAYHKGIVNGIGFSSGTIYEHKDPRWYPDTFTLHCNLISQKPIKGGITVIEGQQYDIDEGDLLCYAVSEVNHSVTEIIGNIPRILWVFGFSISLTELNVVP